MACKGTKLEEVAAQIQEAVLEEFLNLLWRSCTRLRQRVVRSTPAGCPATPASPRNGVIPFVWKNRCLCRGASQSRASGVSRANIQKPDRANCFTIFHIDSTTGYSVAGPTPVVHPRMPCMSAKSKMRFQLYSSRLCSPVFMWYPIMPLCRGVSGLGMVLLSRPVSPYILS